MPTVRVNGVNLYYEESGSGTPLVFLHEFAGDHRSWENQMRHFARRFRCITWGARGYPPSDVPGDPGLYSQDIAIEDMRGLLDALNIGKAHLCGLSMGANAALYFGLRYPERALSLTIAGGGYGAGQDRGGFRKEMEHWAGQILTEGLERAGAAYAKGPARIQLFHKDPRGWESFRKAFLGHSSQGSAYTLLGVQCTRPNILELGEPMKACNLPVLILLGDEDTSGLEGSLFMKQCLPRAGMMMFPKTGHTVNLEEPDLFNRTLLDFLTAVDAGHWSPRDPVSLTGVL